MFLSEDKLKADIQSDKAVFFLTLTHTQILFNFVKQIIAFTKRLNFA